MKRIYELLIIGALIASTTLAKADSLNKANEAFLQKDFKTMTGEIKNTLLYDSNDPLIKSSAMDLLMKAYEVADKDGLPTDWELPGEITRMKVTIRFVAGNYKLRVTGNAPLGTIDHLQVTRVYPKQVVIDSKVDQLEELPAVDEDGPQFNIKAITSHEKIPTGLYLLTVDTKQGHHVDGYFIVDESMNSEDMPKVVVPSNDHVFKTGNPTFKWVDFMSSQYKPYEKRSLYVGVYGADEPNPDVWEVDQSPPTIEETTIGITSEQYDGRGQVTLANGNYVVNVTYREKKKFGPLTLARESGTTRSFTVRQ